MSHEAKVEHENRYHREELARIWGNCSKILAALLKNRDTKVYFGEPVRADFFPKYYTIIKDPRDLGTIKSEPPGSVCGLAWPFRRRRASIRPLWAAGPPGCAPCSPVLASRRPTPDFHPPSLISLPFLTAENVDSGRFYNDIRAFRDDVRLTFDNCRAFNPPGDLVRKLGDQASERFEQRWAQMGVEASWDAAQRRHVLAIERLQAEAQSLPDKIAEVDAELQALVDKAAAREALPPPGPGRDMTFEEKRKLSHAVGTLPGERLARVLEIIAEGPSAPAVGEEDEECELDIDSLDVETLWKMQAFVDAVQAEIDSKAARPPSAGGAAGGAGAPAGGEKSVGTKGADGALMRRSTPLPR
jgi:hypothetical protein